MIRHYIAISVAFVLISTAAAQDSERSPQERAGTAKIIRRSDVIKSGTATNRAAAMRLWPLYSTPESRMNYVEVTGRSALHFHPDADHKLYVLEGRVVVIAGTNSGDSNGGRPHYHPAGRAPLL